MESGFGGFHPECGGSKIEHEEESFESQYALEKEQATELLEELDQLISRIIECGPDLDPQVVVGLRQRISSIFGFLDVTSFDDPKLRQLRVDLHLSVVNLPVPKGYPSVEEFNEKFKQIAESRLESQNPCDYDPNLAEIIDYCPIDISQISRRGGNTLEEYLYNLGIVMSDNYAYKIIFRNDPITIRHDWSVANGRHRVTTLKCLGEEYINHFGMQSWIETKAENRNEA